MLTLDQGRLNAALTKDSDSETDLLLEIHRLFEPDTRIHDFDSGKQEAVREMLKREGLVIKSSPRGAKHC